jgi:hypothetical protein
MGRRAPRAQSALKAGRRGHRVGAACRGSANGYSSVRQRRFETLPNPQASASTHKSASPEGIYPLASLRELLAPVMKTAA